MQFFEAKAKVLWGGRWRTFKWLCPIVSYAHECKLKIDWDLRRERMCISVGAMTARHRLIRSSSLQVFTFLWRWRDSPWIRIWSKGYRGYRSMSRVTWSLLLWRTTDEAFWEIPEDQRWTPLGVNYTSICLVLHRSLSTLSLSLSLHNIPRYLEALLDSSVLHLLIQARSNTQSPAVLWW